jgi:hypothetical protein
MDNASTVRTFHWKGFASFFLALAFLTVACSGTMLFIAPGDQQGESWTVLSLDREGWEAVHLNAGCLLVLVAVWHVLLNGRVFLGYVRKEAGKGWNLKWELAVAVAIALIVVAGTVLKIPPFDSIMELHEMLEGH